MTTDPRFTVMSGRWIPVEECMPTNGERVLYAQILNDEVGFGAYEHDRFYDVEDEGGRLLEGVTDWYKLPGLPRREERATK